MSKTAGESGTGDSIVPMVLGSGLGPFRMLLHCDSSLFVERHHLSKNKDSGHRSVLGVFSTTTSEPEASGLSALEP